MKNTTKMMPLSELREAPYNPRRISEQALAGLEASIKTFGLTQPIVWNKRTKQVVSGHQRLKALKNLGEKEALVLIVDWPEIKEKAANLAHNNTAIEGEFTDDADALQREIEAADKELYDELLLDQLDVPEKLADETVGIDDVPAAHATTKRKTGEIWQLGRHRIMCGDSTDPKSVAKLMDTHRAQMIFTDPPYGVDYNAASGKFAKIKGDDKKGDDLANKLLLPALKNAVIWSRQDAAFYIWHASSTREDFAYAMKQAGLVERSYIIWAKPSAALGWGDYQWAHEPCFYASKDGQEPTFHGDRKQSTLWRFTWKTTKGASTVLGPGVALQDGTGGGIVIMPDARGRKIRTIRIGDVPVYVDANGTVGDLWEVGRDSKTAHPTQKPVALARRAILNSSAEDDIVLDLFLGSGATLLGAQLTDRICYGMELDRGYCEATIERWESLTGQRAKKI